MSSTVADPRADRAFFGHPRGLANLFGVEMWERFSYYGMLASLTLYLYYEVAGSNPGLGLPKSTATSLVGAYGGLVYVSTIAGAWVADRVLGAERTLFCSAVLVMLGHIALAVLPGFAGVGVGLACVALGSGGVKGNATAVVGTLYAENDDRRDAGFSLFYMGINTGALIGPLLTGLTRSTLGFHYAFGVAAIGMAIGLIQYTIGRGNLGTEASTVPNPLPRSRWTMVAGLAALAVATVAFLILIRVITAANLSTAVVAVCAVAAVVYFSVILTSSNITAVERSRVLSFIPLFVVNAVFWSLYQQQFTVVEIYADGRTDRNLFGWQMPTEWVTSFNPVFIILLAPVFALLWIKLGPRQPPTPIKFALGTVIMGLAFLLFLPWAGGTGATTPLLAVAVILLVFAIGELLISPVGLSLATKISPKVFRSQTVALYFLSVALGTAMSGSLAGYYSPQHEAPYFGILGAVAIVVGLIVVLLSPMIRRLMSGVR
ncbi:MAG: oligopeptide:H+ symporter [Pseudonocardiaceae bacterium]|jgi:POT family proton-dependent oligopeptide transporter|nr:oligopeptide:H+ symporter [Pseudonocardiaceae bacterium]